MPRKQTVDPRKEIVRIGIEDAFASASSIFRARIYLKQPKPNTSKLNTSPIIIIFNICVLL